MKGSILAIAFGPLVHFRTTQPHLAYGSLLGGRMERATSFGVRVAGGIWLFLVLVLVTLIELKII